MSGSTQATGTTTTTGCAQTVATTVAPKQRSFFGAVSNIVPTATLLLSGACKLPALGTASAIMLGKNALQDLNQRPAPVTPPPGEEATAVLDPWKQQVDLLYFDLVSEGMDNKLSATETDFKQRQVGFAERFMKLTEEPAFALSANYSQYKEVLDRMALIRHLILNPDHATTVQTVAYDIRKFLVDLQRYNVVVTTEDGEGLKTKLGERYLELHRVLTQAAHNPSKCLDFDEAVTALHAVRFHAKMPKSIYYDGGKREVGIPGFTMPKKSCFTLANAVNTAITVGYYATCAYSLYSSFYGNTNVSYPNAMMQG